MSKSKKIAVIIVSCIICVLILLYFSLSLLSSKPGMNGFEVTNGMLELILFDKDYVKVNEHCYLLRDAALKDLLQKDYDSVLLYNWWDETKRGEMCSDFEELAPHLDTSQLLYCGLAVKDGVEYNPAGFTVWNPIAKDVYSLYFVPNTDDTRLDRNPRR